jgi:cell division protein FtsW
LATERRGIDRSLLLVTMLLTVIGLAMILSASYVKAEEMTGDPFFFFKKQLIWLFIGFGALLCGINIDYRKLRPLAKPILWVAVILLGFVLLEGSGHSAKGSARWIGFGMLKFQPSELAKLAVAVYLASVIADKPRLITNLQRGFLPLLGILMVVFFLVLKQPDLGTGITILVIGFVLLAAGGARIKHLSATALFALPASVFAWLFILKGYQKDRVLTFLNPQSDPQGKGYHIIQSLIALGSGGLLGAGFGNSKQKFLYLPEQHTDFIFAIIGEELGLIGAAAVVCLFIFYAWRGYRAAVRSSDAFGALLACGLTTMVICQALINIGVVTSSMPVTGIPLPFISYGGSSLTLLLFATGLLLNISKSGGRVQTSESGNRRRRNRRTYISGAGNRR